MKTALISVAIAAALLAGSAKADEMGTPVFYGTGPHCYKVVLAESGHGYAVVFDQTTTDAQAIAMVQELGKGVKRQLMSNGIPYAEGKAGCGDGSWAVVTGVFAP